MGTRVKLYEAWKAPGGKEIEGRITSFEAKPIGAVIIISSSTRKFRIHHHNDVGPYGCWILSENKPVGTKGAIDNWEHVDEFSRLSKARTEARKLAMESQISGPAFRPGASEAVIKDAALACASMDFVRDLAKDWIREGHSGDNPSVAKAAYDLLVRHGEKPPRVKGKKK